MSGASIIKEYLVSLGFKVDQNSLNKFDSGLAKTGKAALTFATTLVGVAAATTAFVDKVATEMEGLYWSSVRVKEGVSNIQDFKLGLSKLGGTAEGAAASLESVAKYMRTNPAAEGFMRNLGITTRKANGDLMGSIGIVKQLAHLPMPYWLKVKFAERFGVDEQTLQAAARDVEGADDKLTKLYKDAGINADEAARRSVEFENKLKDQKATWGVLATVLEYRLLPVANKLMDWADSLAGFLIRLDGLTGGLSTDMFELAAAVFAVNFAMKLTFGEGIIKALVRLAVFVAALAETAFPALAEAILSVGLAIEATPIGWILLIATLLAAAAFLIIHNWDKVKAYFSSFVGWLRDKYNTVAKFLGLPKWEEDKKKPSNDNEEDDNSPANDNPTAGFRFHGEEPVSEEAPRKKPKREGELPDYQSQERNLEPNSMYGSKEITGKALEFFKKAGWSANQSAGIVANLIHESNLKKNAVGDGGQARGIAQWHPDRQADFEKWSGKKFDDATTDDQLAFVNYELRNGTRKLAGKLLAGATNAAQAGMIVSKYYEAPADQQGEMAKRGRTAEQLVGDARLDGASSGNRTVIVNNKTDIKVSGSEPAATARAVGREQGRVLGDQVRNFAGAQS